MGKRGINHYLAGACFLISVLCMVLYAAQLHKTTALLVLSTWKYNIILCSLLAVSVFANKPVFTIFGGAIYFIYHVVSRAQNIIEKGWSSFEIISISLLLCAFFLILTGIAGMKHKDTRITAIIAGVFALMFSAYEIFSISNIQFFSVIHVITLTWFFVGVGSILMGFAFSTKGKKLSTINGVSSNGIVSDKIEQLTKLTALLDKGIITQEEFDEKKKQIMG